MADNNIEIVKIGQVTKVWKLEDGRKHTLLASAKMDEGIYSEVFIRIGNTTIKITG